MELAELTDADGERNTSNYLVRCIPAGTHFLHIDVTMAFLNGVLEEDTNYVMHGQSLFSGMDYWNGLLEWTTGMPFDLKFSHKNPIGVWDSVITLLSS